MRNEVASRVATWGLEDLDCLSFLRKEQRDG